MIKSLTIQNFQSHEKTKLTFSPGVNVVVGSSDAGKTAIIRALRWVVWNRPSGDSIRSTWGGSTSVKLELSEGKVIRNKDKSDSYLQTVDGNEELAFKAFGTSIPEEISRLLNINEINLQQQLDAPFLLSDSPGEVAQHFNKVARLDKIDLGIQQVNSVIRELTSSIGHIENDISTHQGLLGEFEHLEKFEVEVEVLEEMEKRLNSLRKKEFNLQELISDIEVVNMDIKDKSRILKKEEDILDLLKLYNEKEEAEEERLLLSKVISSINNIKDKLKNAKEKHASLLEKFNRLFPSVCPLCGQKVKK
jgi:exonuclease SbcC